MTSMGHFQGHFLEAKSEAYHSPNSAGDGFEAIERPDSVVVTKKWFLLCSRGMLLKRGVRLAPPTKWAVSPGQSSFHKPMSWDESIQSSGTPFHGSCFCTSSPWNSVPQWNHQVKEGRRHAEIPSSQNRERSSERKNPRGAGWCPVFEWIAICVTHMLWTRLFERSFPTPSVALPSGVGSLFKNERCRSGSSFSKYKMECLRKASVTSWIKHDGKKWNFYQWIL